MEGARAMMEDLLDQQRREFMALLTLERANARGRAPMVNEPIVVKQVHFG